MFTDRKKSRRRMECLGQKQIAWLSQKMRDAMRNYETDCTESPVKKYIVDAWNVKKNLFLRWFRVVVGLKGTMD